MIKETNEDKSSHSSHHGNELRKSRSFGTLFKGDRSQHSNEDLRTPYDKDFHHAKTFGIGGTAEKPRSNTTHINRFLTIEAIKNTHSALVAANSRPFNLE